MGRLFRPFLNLLAKTRRALAGPPPANVLTLEDGVTPLCLEDGVTPLELE